MKPSSALSSAKSRRQRGLLSRILLRPFTIALFAAFLSGAALVGWFKLNEQPDLPSQYGNATPISVPQISVASAPALPSETYDFRGSGYSVSDNPRQLRPMEEAVLDLQAIAPAAGPVAVVPAPDVIAPPLARQGGKPQIAIVVDDLGPDYQGSMAAITLPKEVTLSFLPYAEKLQRLVARAKDGGHELLVHMPMEPVDMAHNDPGPDALTLNLTPEQIDLRVQAALNSFEGYVGLNNHMGSRFTADMPAMQIVMNELAKKDLIFFDSRTTPQSVGIDLATRMNMKFIGRDVFLDNEVDTDLIMAQLSSLERLARVQGHATAIGHPHAATIAALKAWIPEAQARGIELVPISALAQRLGTLQASTGSR